jgi:hypothetical protein
MQSAPIHQLLTRGATSQPRTPRNPQAREAFQPLIDGMYDRLPKGEAPPAGGAQKSSM